MYYAAVLASWFNVISVSDIHTICHLIFKSDVAIMCLRFGGCNYVHTGTLQFKSLMLFDCLLIDAYFLCDYCVHYVSQTVVRF